MEEEQAVVPKDHCVNLPVSWRMEPSLTALTSKLFYKGERQGKPANCVNRVHLKNSCQGLNGLLQLEWVLVFEQVEHTGRSVHAPKEDYRVVQLVDSLLGSNYTINKRGISEKVLHEGSEFLVFAPYIVYDNKLEERLEGRSQVGTGDHFQGQEAPIYIYTLTSISCENSPHWITFMHATKRTNSAGSRYQCLLASFQSKNYFSRICNSINSGLLLNKVLRMKSQEP